MTNLLMWLVKLARDAQHTDAKIADELLEASKRVRAHGFWPS
jgi:hypothetical protein